jgi:RNA polymerase sigma-70 factor (ECF subfamily)
MNDNSLGLDTMEEPDDAPQNEQTIQQLEQALDRLPPNEQAVVSMFYYDNMSLAEIAFVTGSNTSTVGSQLSRIRKKLYRMIKTS